MGQDRNAGIRAAEAQGASDQIPQVRLRGPTRSAASLRPNVRPASWKATSTTSSIAAEIITGKYGYHLPLYRLQDYFAGSGWTPSRSTQCNILANVDFILEPLLEFFQRTVQSDSASGLR